MRSASLYSFRDFDLMMKLRGESGGISSRDVAKLIGFDEEGEHQAVAIRLAWMHRYGMVAFDRKERLWSLSPAGERIAEARLRAPQIALLDQLPDEAMVEVMAHITSRHRHGQEAVAHTLRREFLYGTQRQ